MTPSKPPDPTLEVRSETPLALLDERITVRATGLDSGERVALRTEMNWDDSTYSAEATFDADEDGIVTPAETAPVDGPYEGVRPMGLFWSMTPDDNGISAWEPPAELPTTVSLKRDGKVLASVDITRRTRATDTTKRTVDAASVPADLYLPAGDGPHPGVVVLGGSDGGYPRGPMPWLLAAHGYAVLGPAYFGEDGSPADVLSEVPVEAVEDAVEWFGAHDAVRAEPLGVIGRSRGSELAFLLAGRLDAVRTAVGVVPSGVAFEGLGENFRNTGTSAWAVDGEPIPYVPFDFSVLDLLGNVWGMLRKRPIEIRGAYIGGIEAADPDRVAAAELPAAETDGPILLLAGEADAMWASAPLAERLRNRLVEAGFEYEVDVRAYPDAGHAIGVPYLPTTERASAGEGRMQLALGGSPSGYAEADEDGWRATLETLETGLRSDARNS